MGDWPIFLARAMHEDMGDLFAVGDTISWDVELVDGRASGWPDHVLADVMVTIRPRPLHACTGAIADAGTLKACWRGPEPPGTVLALSVGLVADLWNPPFRATVTGTVRRIRTVAYAHAERGGVLVPNGPWALEDIERTARWLKVSDPRGDPSVPSEEGLLINLALSANTIWN
jgi:hypothetical protein